MLNCYTLFTFFTLRCALYFVWCRKWTGESHEHADCASAGAEACQHRTLPDCRPGAADDDVAGWDGHALARTVSSRRTGRHVACYSDDTKCLRGLGGITQSDGVGSENVGQMVTRGTNHFIWAPQFLYIVFPVHERVFLTACTPGSTLG